MVLYCNGYFMILIYSIVVDVNNSKQNPYNITSHEVLITFYHIHRLDEIALLFVGDTSFSGAMKIYVEHKYHTYNGAFN